MLPGQLWALHHMSVFPGNVSEKASYTPTSFHGVPEEWLSCDQLGLAGFMALGHCFPIKHICDLPICKSQRLPL